MLANVFITSEFGSGERATSLARPGRRPAESGRELFDLLVSHIGLEVGHQGLPIVRPERVRTSALADTASGFADKAEQRHVARQLESKQLPGLN